MRSFLSLVLCVGMLILTTRFAHGDFINFETGFTDLQPVNVVSTSTNKVTFAVGTGSPTGPAFIAEAGDPLTAFGTSVDPVLPNDTPVGGGSSFSLTDADVTNSPELDYFLSFALPVLNLTLDLYDYRTPEGPVQVGDAATLTAFSDSFVTPVAMDIFTVTGGLPDGNVATLMISSPSAPILSASLTFSAPDGGTAIDNIRFTTIPEPSAGLLFLVTTLCMVKYRTRRSRVE